VGVSSNVAFGSVCVDTGTRYFTGINSNWVATTPTNQLSETIFSSLANAVGCSSIVRLSDTAIMVFWYGTTNTIYARVYTLNADGSTNVRGAQTSAATTYAGSYEIMDAVAISSTSVLLVWHNTSNTLSARICSISGTTVTYGAVLTFGTSGSLYTPNLISLLSPTLATVCNQGNYVVYSIGISGTTLTNNANTTVNDGGGYPIYGIFTASSTTSVVFYMDSTATKMKMAVVTNNGSSFTVGTSVVLFTSASNTIAVSKLATGLGMVVPSLAGGNTVPAPYYMIAVSGGLPYVKSQGLLPPNLNQLPYLYPRNGTCVVQTGIAGGATTGYASSQQKVVITGAE